MGLFLFERLEPLRDRRGALGQFEPALAIAAQNGNRRLGWLVDVALHPRHTLKQSLWLGAVDLAMAHASRAREGRSAPMSPSSPRDSAQASVRRRA